MPRTRAASISFQPPTIQFRTAKNLLAEAALQDLRRFIVVTCFEPEVAPGPDPTQFDLLDFGQTYWLVPDGSAERFLDQEWASHLLSNNGYLEAEAGALPFSWRASFLGVFRSLYKPRAAVVAAQDLTFLSLQGPFDPTRLSKDQRTVRSEAGRGFAPRG